MDGDGDLVGGSGGGQEVVVYVSWGGELDDGGGAKVTYVGGWTKCFVVKEDVGLGEVRRMVSEVTGDDLTVYKMWYSLKYDRGMVMEMERDADVRMFVKGNDEHGYMYVASGEGPRRRGQNARGSSENGVLCGGGRKCMEEKMDDGGRGGGGKRRIVTEADGGNDEHVQTRMRDGGEIIEMSDDDEISVASDDVGDEEEAVAEGGEECSKGTGVEDSGNGNENVWPRSGLQAQSYYRKLSIWKKLIRGVGQIFQSAEAFRQVICKYAIANRFSYRFMRNCKQRIVVRCDATDCPFYICVRGGKNTQVMSIKDFVGKHKHSVGELCQMGVWGRRRVRAELLAHLIEEKVRLCIDYAPRDIMQDLELELGIRLTYMQSWRAREFVRMMVLGMPNDHYKLLPWLCAAIVRANPGSVAFCEVEGSRFCRMFVAYAANINGFKLGCRKILFVDGCHLSGPYQGTMLAACALDADNHLFNFAYAIVSGETIKDWVWFLQTVMECLGGLKPVIISDRHPALLAAVPQVCGKEYHSYCLRHLTENFLKEAAKHGIRKEVTKQVVKEMFYRVAYVPTVAEYNAAVEELRSYKAELGVWVDENEPAQWAASKFTKERWGRMNNNVIESWNYWMRRLRPMPVPWLVTGHLEKLGKKMDKQKQDITKWKNGVGERIEQKLVDSYQKMGCIAAVEYYSMMLGEYSVQLSNSRKLVVKLGQQTCTCRQWQTRGIPCCHALAVISSANLWVYDFVHPIYKTPTQHLIYNQFVHPMETHDLGTVDRNTGRVVGGDDLDEDYDRCILPPCNGRPPGRPRAKWRESQTRDKKSRRCSKCGEVGHTRRTCRNPRADFDAHYEGDVVAVEDLLDGSYVPGGSHS